MSWDDQKDEALQREAEQIADGEPVTREHLAEAIGPLREFNQDDEDVMDEVAMPREERRSDKCTFCGEPSNEKIKHYGGYHVPVTHEDCKREIREEATGMKTEDLQVMREFSELMVSLDDPSANDVSVELREKMNRVNERYDQDTIKAVMRHEISRARGEQ